MHLVYVLYMHAFLSGNLGDPLHTQSAMLAMSQYTTLAECETDRIIYTNKFLAPNGKAFLDARHIGYFNLECLPREVPEE